MKQLKYLLLILPFLFIGSVKADTYEYIVPYKKQPTVGCNYYYFDYEYLLEQGFKDKIERLYSMVMEEYNNNFKENYKYYVISLTAQDSQNCNTSRKGISIITMSLLAFNEEISFSNFNYYSSNSNSSLFDNVSFTCSYDVSDNLYTSHSLYYYSLPLFKHVSPSSSENYYNPLAYFISNYNFVNSFSNIVGYDGHPFIYNVTGYGEDFTVGVNDTIYPMFSADSPFDDNNNYVEVNLNDYAYVALSLKDYKQEPFSTQVYAKGNYCITPVYNYGMTERNEILSGTKVERCSPYYETYTPIRTYILDSDLNNNAIYYLKAYDTSKDNYVKIDTSIFDITYITEENKDDPYVMINGKSYPTIPYDSLTDTATKSEDEGYVSGAVEEFSFTDIFTAPLEALKDVWDAVVSFFAMITEFIVLLPAPLQGFLYTSFTLAIVLGLIKILL